MVALSLTLAMVAACLPTGLWLTRLVPPSTPARWLMIAGYSVPLGILLTTLQMRLLSVLGISFSLASLTIPAIGILLAGALLPTRFRFLPNPAPVPPQPANSRAEKLIISICLALIASRLLVLGMELTTRPLYAWDAKQHWAKQARVFYEWGSTVPYVSLQEWLQTSDRLAYTNMHPDYPKSIPLLQAFTATFIGAWNDSLINTFWLVMWAGMGLVLFAQARVTGARPALAWGGTYMVLSMPYLNTQVALGGYADLLLSTCFLGAVAALYNWSHSRATWQLALALLCGFGGLLVKNEGFYWLLALLPGLVLTRFGIARGSLALAGAGLAAFAAIWLMPPDFAVAGHSLEELDLGYRPESWSSIFTSLLVHDNWHLSVYLFLGALLAVPLLGCREIPGLVVILSALLLYLALYLLTANAAGAVKFTSLNRVALQLLPAMGFFSLAIAARFFQRQALATTARRRSSQSLSPP